MDQNSNHNMKKRVRNDDDQGDSASSEKKQQQISVAADSDAAALGVFDFPWLKDGVGTVRSEEWNLEDGFVSQLRKVTDEISAGIGFPFPGSCSFSCGNFPISDCQFPTEQLAVEEYERCRSLLPPLESIGLETVESFDRIWSDFA